MNKIRKVCPICSNEEYKTVYQSTSNLSKDLNVKIFSARRLPDRVHSTIVKCRRCGLIRSLEIISEDQLNKLYAKSKFTYDNLTDNLENSYIDILNNATSKLNRKKIKILEIGCGNGFLLAKAKEVGYSNIVGLEPSSDAIEKAPKTIQKNIKLGMFVEDIFPTNSFDIICAFQVFDHIPNPNSFLSICYKLLRPGGKIVLMNHDVGSWSAKILGERSPIFDIEHPYLYSFSSIKKILVKNQFKIEKVYSPPAIMTLRYITRLLPIPNWLKKIITGPKFSFLDFNLKIYPGNLCAIAIKK